MSCDVGKATEGLQNELWRGWSDVKVGEWAELMSCGVGKATEGLENELWRRCSDGKVGEWALLYLRHSSFSNPSFSTPTSQTLHLIHLASRPWNEIKGELRILHNAEIHALYSSHIIIRNLKSRRLRLAGHVACVEQSRNVNRILVRISKLKSPLRSCKGRGK